MKQETGKSFINQNRIIIGVVCIIIALLGAFVILPTLSTSQEKLYSIYILKSDIAAGNKISDDNIEVGKTSDKLIASLTAYKKEQINGKVAARNLAKGNYIYTADLIMADSITADNIPIGKEIISIAIKDIAMDVSYQIKSGDIVRMYSVDNKTNEVVQPKELQYVEVEGVYNSNGVNVTNVEKDSDDTKPAAINFIVDKKQAAVIVPVAKASNIYLTLISRGSLSKKQSLLQKQSDLIK